MLRDFNLFENVYRVGHLVIEHSPSAAQSVCTLIRYEAISSHIWEGRLQAKKGTDEFEDSWKYLCNFLGC